ncbi:MAG TPA: nicotinamidase [Planctomycetaceae bacterium]|nr:nicotinamidase [Planctomycetaceae bacterium]
MPSRHLRAPIAVALLTMLFPLGSTPAQPLELTLRSRSAASNGRFLIEHRDERWEGARTAVIVCDMWDAHHCLNAVRREQQLAPRVDRFLRSMRERGALIVHAPSSCMEPYADHPARARAQQAPRAANLPDEIGVWCYSIPSEEAGVYPLDQTDGGEDDDPAEHAKWHEQLASLGRNPLAPWQRQIDAIGIDAERDAISDDGVEIWNLLEAHDIDQVMLLGVHTNMCVLGRPFGLRQMARNGKRVVLVRDLTDTMYNPQRWPYVSHFAGTDRIVEHIEKFVCPTITSDQVLGDREFRYAGDHRPHLVALVSEDEYETARTLPEFLNQELASTFRTSIVFGRPDDPSDLAGWRELDRADVIVLSVRRRTPPVEQLDALRRAVERGVPVVGIRTASHAFALREGEPAEGRGVWPEFDHLVLGGNYHDHYGNRNPGDPPTILQVAPEAIDHPLVAGLASDAWPTTSWLYKTGPLAPGATLLMTGQVGEHLPEPLAWTYVNRWSGRVFYTSLGHPDDFDNANFRTLLRRAIVRTAGLEGDVELPIPGGVRTAAPPRIRGAEALSEAPSEALREVRRRGRSSSHGGTEGSEGAEPPC